ncbi:Abi family protein [Carnobacterium gallinarum]|uniref:Abi family protein n=1 Tax=Carnobacterium gallinarum TaxID=2749 RepID=UPI00054D32DF|nr:Abi family protein [Carnobacterium gallinarum]
MDNHLFLTDKIKFIYSIKHTLKRLHKCEDARTIKPYKSVPELITHLEQVEWNPLTFTEQEKEIALHFFTYTNYYNFSVYRKHLPREPHKQHTFSDCLKLYDFDTFLRENINKFTGIVELMVRATLTTELCTAYTGDFNKADFYLDLSIYQSKNFGSKVLSTIFERVNNSKSESILHHLTNKNGHIPFWVLVEELTFGELCTFFEALTKEYRTGWLFRAFSKQESKHLITWFNSCRYMRNTCAHYSRIYGRYFTFAPPKYLLNDLRKAEVKKNQNETLFARLLAIKNILAYSIYTDHEKWNNFIKQLRDEISEKETIIRLDKMGFPINWYDMLYFENFH